MMTTSQIHKVSGFGLAIGAVAFVVHVVLRSLVTAGVDQSTFAQQSYWVPINALGFLGAMLVLLGLPALYMRMTPYTGTLGLVGIALIAVAWTFFGVFLSLYAALLLPWLAASAPNLVVADAPLPMAFNIAFIIALVSWLAGTLLLAIPFIRRRMQPTWIGYLLTASALWVVVGNVVIAPSGPASNVVVNLFSNLGPVLLLVAVGYLGARMARDATTPLTPAH